MGKFTALCDVMSLRPIPGTLEGLVQAHVEREAVGDTLNRDLNRDGKWCDLLGTKLNSTTTPSDTAIPQSTHELWMELF